MWAREQYSIEKWLQHTIAAVQAASGGTALKERDPQRRSG